MDCFLTDLPGAAWFVPPEEISSWSWLQGECGSTTLLAGAPGLCGCVEITASGSFVAAGCLFWHSEMWPSNICEIKGCQRADSLVSGPASLSGRQKLRRTCEFQPGL